MELKIDWPEGATHFCRAFGRYPTRAYKFCDGAQFYWTGFDWHPLRFPPVQSIVRNLIARELPTTERANTWGGIGLPPVGAVCEAELYKGGGWIVGFVAYYGKAHFIFESTQLTVGVEVSSKLNTAAFRPIKTPEQLAAEARAAALSALMHDAGITSSAFADDPEAMSWGESLLDAGWVKP